MERMIEQSGGFPPLEDARISPAAGLGMWLWLLGEANDQKRLYEAAGIALGCLIHLVQQRRGWRSVWLWRGVPKRR